jgi:flagellar hook-length control protein FliK
MAARLAGSVASPVDSTSLPSSSGAAAAPASAGAAAVFAQMIATLTEAKSQPKTGTPSLPKITAPPAGQQAPSAEQTLPKATHSSDSATASPSQRSVKALRQAGKDASRTDQSRDGAPSDANPSAGAAAAAAIVLPPMPASTPASTQPAGAGRVDSDSREATVGSTTARSSGRAEPPATPTTPPSAKTTTTATETRSAALFALPDGTPSTAAPQALSPSPATAVTAISATPATSPATAPVATPVLRTPTTPAPAPASTPAAQIAPALISVAQSASGTQRLTIRLDPPELGTVQIRLERPADAPTQVEINVQRPETMTLLMRDQPHLQHALDQAGVPAEGRTLNFQLDPQDQRGTSGDPGSGHGRRTPTPAAQQMQAEPDDPDDSTAGTMRWSRVALDITA